MQKIVLNSLYLIGLHIVELILETVSNSNTAIMLKINFGKILYKLGNFMERPFYKCV